MMHTNGNALALLICAKIFGVVGLVLAYGGKMLLGGSFMALSGVLLVSTVAICLKIMKNRDAEDRSDIKVLEKMMNEGTLDEYIRALKEKEIA